MDIRFYRFYHLSDHSSLHTSDHAACKLSECCDICQHIFNCSNHCCKLSAYRRGSIFYFLMLSEKNCSNLIQFVIIKKGEIVRAKTIDASQTLNFDYNNLGIRYKQFEYISLHPSDVDQNRRRMNQIHMHLIHTASDIHCVS